MAATILSRGQLAIIQFSSENADDPSTPAVDTMNRDSISFVLLAPIGAGTVIYFTDRTWNGTVFSTSGTDGTYTFTAGSDMAAGTAITISTAELNAAGINLLDTGEAIYAYQGTTANTPNNFLFAIEGGDGNNTFNATLTNTGLVAGVDAIGIGADNASFAGRTWNIQTPTLYTNIGAATNWVTNENSPQYPDEEGTNLFTAPDRQIWVAGSGGGSAIQIVNTDGTHSSNLLGYAIAHLYQNTSVDGNPTTQRFFHPTDVVLDTVNDKFFIVDSDGTVDRILQGSISQALNNPGVAPTMTVLYRELPAVSDSSGITGIAIDTTNQDIYFTRNQFLMRVDYNTANQTPVTLADLGTDPDTANPTYANEIGLNLATGQVFIVSTESFSDFLPPPAVPGTVGTIMYRNAIIRVSNVSPSDTNATGNTVDRITWTGVYDETFSGATGTPQATEFEDSFGKIISVDVNTANGDIWFTTVQLNGGANGELGGIYRASIAGVVATVTLVYQETNATNFNFQYIDIDEETGRYYVTSLEPNEANDHSLFSGLLTDAGVAPTFVAHLGNINALGPLGLTVQSAPTLAGTGLTPGVTEASSAPLSGETSQVALYSGLTAADIDPPTGDELSGAQVRISVNFQSGATHQDFLRINGNTSGTVAGSGITYTYNSATGVMTLSGAATVAEYAAALQLVTFSTSGDDVTAYGAAPTRTVAASVFDGLLYSDEVTATVTVTGINDAPVNTPGAAMIFVEDTTGHVGAEGVPPTAPRNAVTGISVFDIDANPATQDITVTLSVGVGTLTIRTDVAGGLAAGEVTGNGTGSLTLTGTQNQINSTLAAMSPSFTGPPVVAPAPNGLIYTAPANYNGATTLVMNTDDGGFNGNDPGNSGTGTSEADGPDNKIINISAVNDAPVVADDGIVAGFGLLEDQPTAGGTTFAYVQLEYSDPTDQQQTGGNPTGSVADAMAGIAIIANGSSGATGQWQYHNGTIWVDIGAASLAAAKQITSGTAIRFSPALNFNGAAPTLAVHLIDASITPALPNGAITPVNLSGVGATGGTTPYSAGTVTINETVTAVNDAPVNAIVGDLNISEDDPAANVTGISVSDLEANPASDLISVTLDVDHGTLAILTNVAGGIIAGDIVSQDADTISIVATQNKINATLAAAGGLTYDSDANYFGGDTVEVTTSDLGNTGQDPVPGTGTNLDEQDVDSKTINIAAVDDLATPAADADDVNEDGTVNIDVVANDTDIDNTPAVAKIDGQAVALGGTITLLTSGATVKLELDGTLTYDPNDKYNTLITTALATATGAVNDTADEVFSYELADGTTANVTVTVHGVTSPEDVLGGDGTDNSITGTSGVDKFYVMQPGTETLDGDAGNDGFFFGAFLDATDDVDGGAGDKDQLIIQGDYSGGLTLGAANLVGIETLVFLSGTDTRFGDSGSSLYSYNITTVDDNIPNVPPGQILKVNFNNLQPNENVTFNGSAESAGIFHTFAGQGTDYLQGGAANDGFFFGLAGATGMFTADDRVDGNGGTDQLVLRGNYTVVFQNDTIVDVESIGLMSGTDTRFGPPAPAYDYDLTIHDDNVGNGQQLSINGAQLKADESMVIDGSGELDGFFRILAGAGDDSLTGGVGNDILFGGAGADTLTGNAGTDTYLYRFATDSTTLSTDHIVGFAAGDKIDLDMIDADTVAAGVNDFNFIGSNAFGGNAGELRSTLSGADSIIEGDTDGDGDADLYIIVENFTIAIGDFNF